MNPLRNLRTQSLRSFLTLSLLSLCSVTAADDCQPSTWAWNARRAESTASVFTSNVTASLKSATVAARADGDIQPGEVNCRYWSKTSADVNYYTCTSLADRYDTTVEIFFILNPDIDPDCGNIQPSTKYCVEGFIEPVRAADGLCGPSNGNATCLGTDFQCCSAETFTCGNTTADCAPGTCYEGACLGNNIYSTDGTCGYKYGNRLCTGKWGNCCDINGACGNSSDFCGTDVCQSGNCTRLITTPSPVTWLEGNTTDGTCGGANAYTCNVVYGNCCKKDGICGGLASDCGAGCQSQFGECIVSSLPSSSTSISSKTSSSSSVTTASHPSSSSSVITTSNPTCTSSSTTASRSTTSLSTLPSCGQTCFNNMLAQYSALGCSSADSYCLCSNVNFSYGLRDCSNGACGTAVASTVIAYGSGYCTNAAAAHMATATATGIASLPSCGQTCFNNMLAQYSALGCASAAPSCLCQNANFGYGLRDCSNGACGTTIASTVIAFGSSYCASATAAS